MRATVADIVVRTLEGLDLAYPTVSDEERAKLQALGETLENEA
jgi:hypothetical protein